MKHGEFFSSKGIA